MKIIRAYAVVSKFNETADAIAESSNGVLVPFFRAESEANEWRWRTKRAEITDVVPVEVREIKPKRRNA